MRRRRVLYLPAVAWAAQPRRWRLAGQAEVFAALDLTRPELGEVAAAWRRGKRDVAWRRLLDYFRRRSGVRYDSGYFWSDPPDPCPAADLLLEENLFDLGFGYPPQRYPPPIAWSADPVSDIEWVANMHRFLWQDILLGAYARTGDEGYAGGWVRLTRDWIQSHSLVDPARFEWLDIQVGIRASRLLQAFEGLKHTAAFDAKFLPLFLAAIHAHARKSYLYPRRDAHNKAIIEADGLYRVATLFPEFREAARWRDRALEVLQISLSAQLTPEGVQREWTPSYHNLVATFVRDLVWLAALNRLAMPDSGAFAYPDTPFAVERPWFRQTAVHQTLTLDRRNSDNRPRPDFLRVEQEAGPASDRLSPPPRGARAFSDGAGLVRRRRACRVSIVTRPLRMRPIRGGNQL